jgi:hypothetical protein
MTFSSLHIKYFKDIFGIFLEEALKKGALFVHFNLNLPSIEDENYNITIFKRKKMM